MRLKHFQISLTILLIFLIAACSSSKRTSQDGLVKRSYHNITARDNCYFNARESMKENEKTLRDGQVDDYTKVLPVFKYGTQEQASSVKGAMVEISTKCATVIKLHPHSKWVDDSYFLIGKANFYKRDYDTALVTFQYIIAEYSDLIKKNPKEENKTKTDKNGNLSFWQKLKHQPVNNEASLWVARTFIEMGNYSDATTVISLIKSNEKLPEDMKAELFAIEADCYIRQAEYAKAIDPLQASIKITDSKSTRARYSFILAQLYNITNDNLKAIDELKNVMSLKPDYSMDFYAKLYMAKYLMNSGVSNSETVKVLQNLLHDEKYKEFYGLIYYTLADIELTDQEKDDGIAHLKDAIAATGDVSLKTQAYLRLADIYYTDQEYKNAFAYYDSTLTGLAKTNDRFDQVTLRKEGLKKLVDELKIIETEEQLQAWAKMNEFDLDKALDEYLKKNAEEDTTKFLDTGDATKTTTAASDGSDFYFYNTTLKARGFTEFQRVWGKRKLEDNWRRSNKTSGSVDEAVTEKEDTTVNASIDLESKSIDKDKIIASLPKTDEQINASNARIAVALYNVGVIYKDNLKNNPKAIHSWEDNITKYPDNQDELQALYQLYITSSTDDKKQYYKDILLKKYSNSLFANIIRDPDYLNNMRKNNEEVEQYYTATYAYYESDSLDIVISRCIAADTLYKQNPFKPKFEMLAAMVLSKQDSVEEFKKSLQDIALKYPADEVGKKAQQILDYIRRGSTIDDAGKTTGITFIYKPEEEHYIVIVLNNSGKDAVTMKNSVGTFNSANFPSANLKVSSLLMGKDKTIILIKSFPTGEQAMDYYSGLAEDENVFAEIDKDNTIYFAISKSNYVQMYKSKDADSYESFFQDNYLKKEDDK